MRIPISIHHSELEEEYCYYDDWEKSVVCADYEARYEYSVDEVELDYADLEDIVNEYFDDIIDIILKDKLLTKLLLKRLHKNISSITDEKSSKR